MAADKLRELQTQINLPELQVKQDVNSHWNSTFMMVDRLLQIHGPLLAVMSHLPKAPEALDANEWHALADYAKVYQLMTAMTEEMIREKYPTISAVIPLIRSVQKVIKNIRIVRTIGIALQTKLIDVISRRFPGWEVNKIAAKAMFLDPGFMKMVFGQKENTDTAERPVTEEIEYF